MTGIRKFMHKFGFARRAQRAPMNRRALIERIHHPTLAEVEARFPGALDLLAEQSRREFAAFRACRRQEPPKGSAVPAAGVQDDR